MKVEGTVPSLMDFALKSTIDQIADQDPDLLVKHLCANSELRQRLVNELVHEPQRAARLAIDDLVEIQRLRVEPSDDPVPYADEWDHTVVRVGQLPFRIRAALQEDYKNAVAEWLELGYCTVDNWTYDGRIQWQLHPWDEFETWEMEYMKVVKKAASDNDVPDIDDCIDENWSGAMWDSNRIVPICSIFPDVTEETILFDAYDYCLNDADHDIRERFQKDLNGFFWGTGPNRLPSAWIEPVHQLVKYVKKPKVRLIVTGGGHVHGRSCH